ncbi:MAG: hypothetical protein ABI479_02930 [Gallionella sp.]
MKNTLCNKACISGIATLISLLGFLPAISSANDISKELSVSISQRKDNLNWSIAGNTVNVLSELKWENMSITQLQAAGEFHLKNDWQIRARMGYGVIDSGGNQDSDYSGNNRTQEFSRSNNKAGGDVFDVSFGFGKKLRLRDLSAGRTFYVTPLGGLSIHQQNLTMTDGVQTLSALPSTIPLGPFPGLASNYDAQWMGPWLGAEALIETAQGWFMIANAEYHLIDYTASANWNLRADFAHPVSFTHTATGEGIVLSLGASYRVGKNWKMSFKMERQNWSTGAGSDAVFLADGTMGYAHLNAVNWDSTAYNFGIARQF